MYERSKSDSKGKERFVEKVGEARPALSARCQSYSGFFGATVNTSNISDISLGIKVWFACVVTLHRREVLPRVGGS